MRPNGARSSGARPLIEVIRSEDCPGSQKDACDATRAGTTHHPTQATYDDLRPLAPHSATTAAAASGIEPESIERLLLLNCLASRAASALDCVVPPPSDAFENVDAQLHSIDAAAVQQNSRDTAARMISLVDALSDLTPSQLNWGQTQAPNLKASADRNNSGNSGRDAGASGNGGNRHPSQTSSNDVAGRTNQPASCLVEDVTDRPEHQELAPLLSAAAAVAACAMHAATGELHSEWVSAATDSAAAAVLRKLLALVPEDLCRSQSRPTAEQSGETSQTSQPSHSTHGNAIHCPAPWRTIMRCQARYGL